MLLVFLFRNFFFLFYLSLVTGCITLGNRFLTLLTDWNLCIAIKKITLPMVLTFESATGYWLREREHQFTELPYYHNISWLLSNNGQYKHGISANTSVTNKTFFSFDKSDYIISSSKFISYIIRKFNQHIISIEKN